MRRLLELVARHALCAANRQEAVAVMQLRAGWQLDAQTALVVCDPTSPNIPAVSCWQGCQSTALSAIFCRAAVALWQFVLCERRGAPQGYSTRVVTWLRVLSCPFPHISACRCHADGMRTLSCARVPGLADSLLGKVLLEAVKTPLLPCRESRQQCSARLTPWQPAWRGLEAVPSSLVCPQTSITSRWAHPSWAAWLLATRPGCSRTVTDPYNWLFLSSHHACLDYGYHAIQLRLRPRTMHSMCSCIPLTLTLTHFAGYTCSEHVLSRMLFSLVHCCLGCNTVTNACRHREAAVDLGGPLCASVGHSVSQLWHRPHCHQDVRQAACAVQHSGLPWLRHWSSDCHRCSSKEPLTRLSSRRDPTTSKITRDLQRCVHGEADDSRRRGH